MTIIQMFSSFFSESWRLFAVPFYNGVRFCDILFVVAAFMLGVWFVHIFFKKES